LEQQKTNYIPECRFAAKSGNRIARLLTGASCKPEIPLGLFLRLQTGDLLGGSSAIVPPMASSPAASQASFLRRPAMIS
jgi:hypothetical protein